MPPPIRNGYWNQPCVSTLGSVCHLTCSNDYIINGGPDIITCIKDGHSKYAEWTSPGECILSINGNTENYYIKNTLTSCNDPNRFKQITWINVLADAIRNANNFKYKKRKEVIN